MGLKIEKAGLFSTIQDTGRYGYQKYGIIVSGAMDAAALRIANLLVGNPENAAAIEATLLGPQIRFEADHLIAITGADLSPTIDGTPVKLWRPVFVPKGSLLAFGQPVGGCRTYISVAGSFNLPQVMGSASTYLRAAIGGLHGRQLQNGDLLRCKEASHDAKALTRTLSTKDRPSFAMAKWTVDPALLPGYEQNPTLRIVKGPEYELFSESSKAYLKDERFKISAQSGRMGYCLQGMPLALAESEELISSAVTFGTVQVPPEGNPIILMADHQTTGGYPRIAQVITADLPKLAQVAPGQTVRFREVILEEAQYLFIKQEQHIEQIKRAMHIKAL